MFSLYDVFMKPLEKGGIRKARQTLMPEAKGKVLEIGSGTGANLEFYDFDQIQDLTITDKKISKRVKNSDLKEIMFIEADVLELPFLDHTFDTIVHTLVFCSVEDGSKGFQELRRVLKSEGNLIFIEHVLPDKGCLRKTFKLINPIWKRVSSGCHLTRSYLDALKDNGFRLLESKQFMKTVFVSGIAVKDQS